MMADKIPDDIMAVATSRDLDDLISSYVHSVTFDGCAGEDKTAIYEWVGRAILAERQRCVEWCDLFLFIGEVKEAIEGGERP